MRLRTRIGNKAMAGRMLSSMNVAGRKRSLAPRLAWLTLCLAAFALYTATYNQTTHRDNDIVLAYIFFALGFPASLLAAWAIGGIAYTAFHLFGLTVLPNGRAGMLVTSVLLVLAGYVQWFILLPRLWRWVRTRLHRSVKLATPEA
jgi:hypothetical protein